MAPAAPAVGVALLLLACVCPGLARREAQEAIRLDGEICPSCVLNSGSTHTCGDVTFTLGEPLGEGSWGAVWATVDKKHAVKVEKGKRTGDKFATLKDYEHECGIMADLEGIPGVRATKCEAFCRHNDMAVLVMNNIAGAKDMKQAKRTLDGYDWKSIATQIYKSTIAMLSQGIVNVDQDAKNILVDKSSQVHFIDMGMAERKKEIMQMCRDSEYSKRYSITKHFGDLGGFFACNMQVGQEYESMVTYTLNSLPSTVEAMQGVAEAFCAGSSSLRTDRFHKVSAGAEDKKFLEAFKGRFDYDGQRLASPLLEREDGAWEMAVPGSIRVSRDEFDQEASFELPMGAKLLAVKCSSDYRLSYCSREEEIAGASLSCKDSIEKFNPVSSKYDICKGTYYFAQPGHDFIRELVIKRLATAGSNGRKFMRKAQYC